MLLVSPVKDLIPLSVEESTPDARCGALTTVRGCAVLTGSLLLDHLLGQVPTPLPRAVYSWLLLALFPLCNAVALRTICRPSAVT